MTSMSQALRVTVSLMMLTMLGACANGSSARNSFCLIYEPVYTCDADTEKTRQQADRNNAVWFDLCEVQ